MSEEATLVELLRSTELTNGSISLRRIQGGGWSAVIAHNRQSPDHLMGHMVHPFDAQWDDPVEALRVALIEDERLCRDLQRRYREAPKFGAEPEPTPVVGALPVIDPDFDAEDCLG